MNAPGTEGTDAQSQTKLMRAAMSALPPRVPWHVALALSLLALLWAFSFPGVDFAVALIAVCIIGLLGILWLIGLVVWRRDAAGRSAGWRWAIGPVLVAAGVALLIGQVPFNMRFAAAKSDFDAAVSALPETVFAGENGGGQRYAGGKQSIGSYDIAIVEIRGKGVLFHEEHGAFLGSAGFAYLPDGPTGEVIRGLKSPEFSRIDGDWYRFTYGM